MMMYKCISITKEERIKLEDGFLLLDTCGYILYSIRPKISDHVKDCVGQKTRVDYPTGNEGWMRVDGT